MSPNNNPCPETDRLADMADVKFFGALSAAMTHDMKNVLAIINENAGLLGDLAVKAQKKATPIDPLKAATISEKIRKNVTRADTMMKRFNRFSHSMDHEAEFLDMEEMVMLVASLSERIIRRHGGTLTVIPSPVPCRIFARRFTMLHLIYRALDTLCRNQADAGPDTEKQMTVRFSSDSARIEICFIRDPGLIIETDALFDSPKDRALLAHVNMKVKMMDAGAGFCLCPARPEHE
jgi:signal transduction histidine kinase